MSLFLVLGTYAQAGLSSVTLSNTTTGDAWTHYPAGFVTAAHILEALNQQAGGTMGIDANKKLTLSLGGDSMSLAFSDTYLAAYLGFTSYAPAATGTSITANNALTAVTCIGIEPSLSYSIAGTTGHTTASQGPQKVSGSITAIMSPTEAASFTANTGNGAHVTPADTERGLYPWTLAVTSVKISIITTAPGGTCSTDARYRVALSGMAQP